MASDCREKIMNQCILNSTIMFCCAGCRQISQSMDNPLKKKSALSHIERLGGALSSVCPSQIFFSVFLWMRWFYIFASFSLTQTFLSTCLLALRKSILISSVTISCQLSLVKTESGVKIILVLYRNSYYLEKLWDQQKWKCDEDIVQRRKKHNKRCHK